MWSCVTPEQAQREGKNASVKLPASEEGAVYYLRELGSAAGFARDEEYHEITLHAGERATLSCAVSSDRGFFELEMTDAQSGAQVAGGSFSLIDRESGESVLTFDMDAGAYRNEMAVPVGAYLLRQTQAAPGYALSDVPEQEIAIEPYLTQGGSMTVVRMRCAALPEGESVQAIDGFYAAREQDMTLVSVDALRPQAGTALLTPSLTISLAGDNGQRLNLIVSNNSNGKFTARNILLNKRFLTKAQRLLNSIKNSFFPINNVNAVATAFRTGFYHAMRSNFR